jgi:UDP-N-acetylmuramate dehydrogenase
VTSVRSDERPVTGRAADLGALAEALGARAQHDHPFGALTTYRVGGTAALFVEVDDEHELAELGRALEGFLGSESTTVPVMVLGNGSNLLVADRGFEGLVVSLGSGFAELSIDGTEVRAGAALSLPVLARRTVAAGLTGLEWAVGVPGSVGGAIRMNAGGHGSETSSTLVSYRWVDLSSGVVHDAPATRLEFGYRRARVGAADVLVSGLYRLESGVPEEGRATIDEIVRWRRANQPGGSNAGSVFTNPPGDSAGRLIDACGLKGKRLGTAEVSIKHANFIQADPDGSADDVYALIEEVRSEVARQAGVELHTEVRLVGFPSGGSVSTGDPEGETR